MVRLRLFFEILLPYAAFVALTALGLAWLGGARYEQSRIDSEVARVRAVAESLSVRRALFVTPPAEWRVVRVDLWKLLGRDVRVQAMSLGCSGGGAEFDQIVLGRTEKDLPAGGK